VVFAAGLRQALWIGGGATVVVAAVAVVAGAVEVTTAVVAAVVVAVALIEAEVEDAQRSRKCWCIICLPLNRSILSVLLSALCVQHNIIYSTNMGSAEQRIKNYDCLSTL